MIKLAVSFFLLGCLSGSGPCLAACGPLLLSFGVGSSAGVGKSFAGYLLFSLSRVTAYLALGVLFYLSGQAVFNRISASSAHLIAAAAGIFICVIGVMIALGHRPPFGKSICAMGFIAGLVPCGPLLAILAYTVMVSPSLWQCLLLLLAYGAGTLISPLAVLCGISGMIPRWLKDREIQTVRVLNIVSGIVIILFGLRLLVSGYKNA